MRTTFAPGVLLGLFLGAGCGTGTAWSDDERQQFVAMQAAVDAQFAAGEAALITNGEVVLPEGCDLRDVDLHLNVWPPVPEEPDALGWGAGRKCGVPGRMARAAVGTTLSLAGHTLAGFDSISDLAVTKERGIVMLATRRGIQTITTRDGVWMGELWRPDLVPSLSIDGSCFVYVAEGFWNDRSMIAVAADPAQTRPLNFGANIHWPIWPGRDGTRIRAIVENEGRIEIRDAGKVIAVADSYANAFFDLARDQLQVHLVTDGKTRWLIDDRLTPALDSYRWIEQSTDGRHHLVVGRDGELDHLVFDGNSVLQHADIVAIALAADGGTWACAVREGDAYHVVRPGGRSAALPKVQELRLAPDGSSLAVLTKAAGGSQWQIDEQPLSGFDAVRDLQLLPAKAGFVFTGRDAAGWWLVVRAAAQGGSERKDGPWEQVGRSMLSADGQHAIALFGRGGTAHRRVLPLP